MSCNDKNIDEVVASCYSRIVREKPKVTFLTGQPRSGKSTYFARSLAANEELRIISVQPSQKIATRHAEFVKSSLKYDDVGTVKDDESLPMIPEKRLIYVSYAWLEHWVWKLMKSGMATIPSDTSCRAVFILDEVHTQTLQQEIGCLALGRIVCQSTGVSGEKPPWCSLHIVFVTAYEYSDGFLYQLGAPPDVGQENKIMVHRPPEDIVPVLSCLFNAKEWKGIQTFMQNGLSVSNGTK